LFDKPLQTGLEHRLHLRTEHLDKAVHRMHAERSRILNDICFKSGTGLSARVHNNVPTAEASQMGFTLVELLVVVAIIGILTALLLPALSKAKTKAEGLTCLNNTRQILLGWTMYAHDNHDVLVQNQNLGAPGEAVGTWVTGFLTWDGAPDNTNLSYIHDSQYAKLAEYVAKTRNVYKCPADRFTSATQMALGWTERVRSVSMNFYVGEGAWPWSKDWFPEQWVVFKRMADFRRVPPTSAWILVDEHPDSINDGALFTAMAEPRWVDLPASYHNGACGFGFGDGHSELKRWLVGHTRLPVRYVDWTLTGFDASDDQRDIRWMQEHTTESPVP
jgi:prepilin-type N-terminal cleavage/methylation domain-containing protein/prepilin-type processing-associated H-X9-DG protein